MIYNLTKKAPKKFYHRKKDRTYKLIKQYPNFWLYEDNYGFKECFLCADLQLLRSAKTVKFKWGTAESLWNYE